MLLFLEPRPLVRWCTRVLEQREVYRLAPHWAAPTDWRVGSDRPLDVLNEALLKARSQHKGTLAVAVHKHDRADVARPKPVGRQFAQQNSVIQFFHRHAPSLSIG